MHEHQANPTLATARGRALLGVLSWLAHALAMVGGGVLVGMIILSVVSVLGRWLASAPVQGDFELIQLGCAICVSCFLPYCQLQRGHVIVDFFTLNLSHAKRSLLDGIAAALMAICAAVISWRLALGLWDVRAVQESSMLLGIPIWWAYAPMVIAFATLAAVAAYIAWVELAHMKRT